MSQPGEKIQRLTTSQVRGRIIAPQFADTLLEHGFTEEEIETRLPHALKLQAEGMPVNREYGVSSVVVIPKEMNVAAKLVPPEESSLAETGQRYAIWNASILDNGHIEFSIGDLSFTIDEEDPAHRSMFLFLSSEEMKRQC